MCKPAFSSLAEAHEEDSIVTSKMNDSARIIVVIL